MKVLFFLLFPAIAFAQNVTFNAEVIPSYDNSSLPVLNEQLRSVQHSLGTMIKAAQLAGYVNNSVVFTDKVQLQNDKSAPGNYQFYSTNSTGVKGWYASPVFNSISSYVVSGTWVKPSGVSTVYVKVWGAGGGGGGDDTGGVGAGGGGGGGYSEGLISVNANVTVTVGVGGSGGTADNAGTNGTASSFAGVTTISAGGGLFGGARATPTGGSGGVGAGGNFNLTGQSGGVGGGNISGSGGSAPMGGVGVEGVRGEWTSNNGISPGGGGSGGNGLTPGIGANGTVIVYY